MQLLYISSYINGLNEVIIYQYLKISLVVIFNLILSFLSFYLIIYEIIILTTKYKYHF